MNITVSWDANPEENIDYYKVYYGVTPNYGSSVQTSETSVDLNDLPDGREVYIGLSAVNLSAEESSIAGPEVVINRYVNIRTA